MNLKKIYIEITNRCNLNCSFCSKDDRKIKDMTISEFEKILFEVKKYTNYIYLHVKGEPLIHKKFKEFLRICSKNNMKVNITTNGVFLKERINDIIGSGAVRQINISLHSENSKDKYIEDILDCVKNINNIYINFRFWTLDNNKLDQKMREFKNKIFKAYNIKEETKKINTNTFISYADKFVWPDLSNDYFNEAGFCNGLKNHIGILSDGTVVVCCLDSKGSSNLGNIYENNLDEILNSEKSQNIIKHFQNRKCYLDICKHCSYKSRFDFE